LAIAIIPARLQTSRQTPQTICKSFRDYFKMIYSFLKSKFLFNDKFSSSKENSIFSTKLIFSSELALNILSILGILHLRGTFTFIDPNIIYPIIISFCVPLIFIFTFIKSNDILSARSSKQMKIFAVTYSVLTYAIFLLVMFKIKNSL